MYARFLQSMIYGIELNWIELNRMELIWYDMIGKGTHLYMHVLAM